MLDVLLFQTPDGGEITFVNGEPKGVVGPESAVFLSLFGGNEEDSGSDGDKPRMWWGSVEESDPAKRYRSELQHVLLGLPITPANLKRAEDAAGRDLAWMVETGYATFVSAVARMPALNTVTLDINGEADGKKFGLQLRATQAS